MVGKHLFTTVSLPFNEAHAKPPPQKKRKNAEKGLGFLNKMSSAVTYVSGTPLL